MTATLQTCQASDLTDLFKQELPLLITLGILLIPGIGTCRVAQIVYTIIYFKNIQRTLRLKKNSLGKAREDNEMIINWKGITWQKVKLAFGPHSIKIGYNRTEYLSASIGLHDPHLDSIYFLIEALKYLCYCCITVFRGCTPVFCLVVLIWYNSRVVL